MTHLSVYHWSRVDESRREAAEVVERVLLVRGIVHRVLQHTRSGQLRVVTCRWPTFVIAAVARVTRDAFA